MKTARKNLLVSALGFLTVASIGGSAASGQTNAYWKTIEINPALYAHPYRVSLFNPQNGEDGARAWSQTKSVFVYGLGVMGILVVLPEEYTGWNTDSDIFRKWYDNISEGPEWDRNNWAYNYIGHTYSGGVYYQVARKSGYRQWDSFLYSFLMSTFYWECGIEAFAEVPSIQDLVVTPVLGWVYGEWAYQTEIKIRANHSEVLGSGLLGSIVLFILDPVDGLGRGVNRLSGQNWIKSGYGYFSYSALPHETGTDHRIYLHLRIPLGVSGPPEQPGKTAQPEHRDDPVDTGIVGVSIGGGYTLLDDEWNVENGLYGKMTLGLYFTPRLSLRLAYAAGDLTDRATGNDVRYENYSLDMQLYLNKNRRIRPYFTTGFGEQIWNKDEEKISFHWNGGIGLHLKIHRKWALQADWINFYNTSENVYDQQFSTALIYRFGQGEHNRW